MKAGKGLAESKPIDKQKVEGFKGPLFIDLFSFTFCIPLCIFLKSRKVVSKPSPSTPLRGSSHTLGSQKKKYTFSNSSQIRLGSVGAKNLRTLVYPLTRPPAPISSMNESPGPWFSLSLDFLLVRVLERRAYMIPSRFGRIIPLGRAAASFAYSYPSATDMRTPTETSLFSLDFSRSSHRSVGFFEPPRLTLELFLFLPIPIGLKPSLFLWDPWW